MSPIIEDFEGPLTEYNRPIKGFGETKTYNVKRGTIVWRWMDDQDRISQFVIPNFILCTWWRSMAPESPTLGNDTVHKRR